MIERLAGIACVPTVGVMQDTPASASTPACCQGPTQSRFFRQTKHNLVGTFLSFWLQCGGLDTFGYPRSEPFVENARWVQYMDRFELALQEGHIAAVPLGRLLTARRFFPRVAPFASRGDLMYFPSTGHTLGGRFRAFWQTHHGSLLLGSPISEVTRETNRDGSGRAYQMQWFENGRLEYHPEFAHTRYEIEFGLVGKQALQRRGWL
jgi:hypothetical protein